MKTRLANQSVVLTAFFAVCFGFCLLWLAVADIPARAQASEPVYADLSEDDWHYEYVAALKEMGIFEGTECEEGFCPGDPLERWQMAVWLVRILDGKDPVPIDESRFTDVDDYTEWIHFIDRLADLEVTDGCRKDPPSYCPQRAVNRSQMAVFLYRAFELPDAAPASFTDVAEDSWAYGYINALAASGITAGCKQEPFSYCPSRSVTRAQMATFLFRALEWQEKQTAGGTNSPNPNPNNIPGYDPDVFYTKENDLSRYIKEAIVDRYAGDNPWLLETWNYTNHPGFTYHISIYTAAVSFYAEYADEQPDQALDRRIAIILNAGRSNLTDRSNAQATLVHELAHVYSLSADATANPVPVAIAHLYFDQLSAGNGLCIGSELYAETAQMLVPTKYNYSSVYWHNCSHLPSRATPEAIQVVEDAFAGRIPQWFYATFQKPDGSLDYEMLWTAVKDMLVKGDRIDVVYQLKDAFGGYCSESLARESAFGDLQLAQPWRDGGCLNQ